MKNKIQWKKFLFSLRYQKKRCILISGFLLGFLLGGSLSATAQGVGFTVDVQLPENQLDHTVSYFDLHVEPGVEQVLEVVISNQTKETKRIVIEPTVATTNENGVIDYSQASPVLDHTLKNPFPSLVKRQPTITLKEKEQKLVRIPVMIPEEPFEGSLLGGLKFSQEKEVDQKRTGKIQISNEFFYIVGVRLRETKEEPAPVLQLKDVRTGQRNYEGAFLAKVQNTTPTIVKELSIESTITKASSSKVLLKDKQEHLSMAPLSSFDYAIPLQEYRFSPGEYSLSMKAKAGEESWSFTKVFVLNQEDIDQWNDLANMESGPSYGLWAVLSLLVVLVSGGVGWGIYRKRVRKKRGRELKKRQPVKKEESKGLKEKNERK
ncbi:DUF916 and DUF3324 domain-containing protein [Enterococcus sp. AZ126]|uniref:DUF916 and DUF3324 domain-containing protein n=1 Tax=Enterococcus sp. AZ126 TaxID=2774635 RepID=UPI003F208213